MYSDRWNKFLSKTRYGNHNTAYDNARSPFERDKDSIIFSDAFRAMQGKTQVFSLAKNDYVRNRLTHSMEVSSVSRNLARAIGTEVISRNKLKIQLNEFTDIVEAASLAHDIGHPPLAHAGEEAVREYFRDNTSVLLDTYGIPEKFIKDFTNFEGNAQNIRILTELAQPSRPGGLRLTSAVLGAITKYPQPSFASNTYYPKYNFFAKDTHILEMLVQDLELKELDTDVYQRSPLVYILEAADDICYALNDIEDSFVMNEVSYDNAVSMLSIITDNKIDCRGLSKIEHIQHLRAKGIGRLMCDVYSIFLDNESDIVEGKFKGGLLDYISIGESFKKLKAYATKHVYVSPQAMEVRVAGYNIIEELIDTMLNAAYKTMTNQRSSKSTSYMTVLPDKYKKFLMTKNPYDMVLSITDFISSMTDLEAITFYNRLLGASLPTRN